MDPKLLEYMRIMSGQPKAEGNPIEEGTMTGIHAAKQSAGMDDAQRARARGMAFMTLGHHLAQPQGYGKGATGTLGALATGILPAAQAYRGEQQQSEAQNAYMMQQAQMEQMKRAQLAQQERMAEAKMAQRAQEQEALQAHRAAQLGETRGYHQGRLGLEERKMAEKAGIAPEAMAEMPGIPLASLTPGARTAEHKTYKEHDTAIKKNEHSIHILNEMKKIFDKHPDIGDSYVHLLNDESYIGKTQRSLMNKDKLTAIQKLNKLGNELIFEKIKGVPAKGLNQFLEKKIGQSVASGESTKDAADFVIKEMINEAKNVIGDSKNYVQSYKKGFIPVATESAGPEIESPRSQMAAPMGQDVQTLRSKHPGAIIMRDPSGNLRPIDPKNVEQARKLGATEVGE